MSKKELLEFMAGGEVPPSQLSEMTRKDVLLSFQGRAILSKFIAFQVLGAIISLSFCPQFGVSFFVEGHGITHVFRMIGDWACALFCGALFLSIGPVLAFLSMKGEEVWWVWRHHKYSLVILPPAFWSILMVLNQGLNLPEENMSYHLTWLVAALFTQTILLKLRSYLYTSFARSL